MSLHVTQPCQSPEGTIKVSCLSVTARVVYKLHLVVHMTSLGHVLLYTVDLLTPTVNIPAQSSLNVSLNDVPRTKHARY